MLPSSFKKILITAYGASYGHSRYALKLCNRAKLRQRCCVISNNKIIAHSFVPYQNYSFVVTLARAFYLGFRRAIMSTKPSKQHIEKHPSVSTLATELAKTMGVQRGYSPVPKNRDYLQKLIPKNRSDLPERTMRDSYTIAAIPLATNTGLQEIMVSVTGFVRVSKLLEDMDIFAVVVAQNYLKNPLVGPEDHSPYTIVTALVNRIDFTDYQPKLQTDIRISGHVTWVGQSSIEVIVWLDQKYHAEYNRITKALFLLAIRDAINSKSAVVNALKATNDIEKKIIQSGELRKKLRLHVKSQELTKSLPTPEEQKVVHDMFKKTLNAPEVSLKRRKLPTGCVWMEECVLSNIVHAHPADRNLHNTVFGGFLMRQAADLSYSLTRLFSKYRPILKRIDDINFTKPVTMNIMIMMHAHVVYTKLNFVQVTVYAQTFDVYTNETCVTNSFHFTYEVSEAVPDVYPKTYDEAMMYIDGMRHFEEFLKRGGDNPFDFEPIEFTSETKGTEISTKKDGTKSKL